MKLPNDRMLLHLARDRRRAIDPQDVYFLEATGETTLVRLRSSRRVRDARTLGELVPLLAPFGAVRVHRNHAVNVRHVLEVRRRPGEADWTTPTSPGGTPTSARKPASRGAGGSTFRSPATWGGKWLPFVRAGYAKNGGALMQKSGSVGFGCQPLPKGDVLGVGFNWGEPNQDTFGPGRRNQYTTEVFYRWQLTPRFAVTPNLQLLVNPALDPKLDRTWVSGVRARLAL